MSRRRCCVLSKAATKRLGLLRRPVPLLLFHVTIEGGFFPFFFFFLPLSFFFFLKIEINRKYAARPTRHLFGVEIRNCETAVVLFVDAIRAFSPASFGRFGH